MVVRPINRRAFLRRAAAFAFALPAAVTAVSACSRTPPILDDGLPVDDDLVLESGLPIEDGAILRVYQWKEYLSTDVLDAFERRYADAGVRIEVESFVTIDEAVARLQDPGSDFDVVFPVIDVLPGIVDAGLLRPLNHDYLPNIANLWGSFRGEGPSYDPGQRYTVPYTVFTSGIGWRADMVDPADAPDVRADPFGVFLDPRYRGLVGFLDAPREALALGLQSAGVRDLVAATDAELDEAAGFLADAVTVADARFTNDGAEEGLATCAFAVHQAWSGDVLTAPRYAAAWGEDPKVTAEALRYWTPDRGARVVGLDLTAICARGRNPVAAHAFVDHLLRLDVALDNFAWNGYQVPMTEATPEAFADPSFPWHDAVPANLRSAIVSEGEFVEGQMLVGFGPSQDARWLAQWSRVVPA